MSVMTKRTRDANGDLADLDLEDASAANRRLDVLLPGDANLGGTRFLGFNWKKSAGVATDVEIFRVDAANGDKTYLLEKLTADDSVNGSWRPAEEEATGRDVDDPDLEEGVGYRIQFSQAGAACTASVTADYKAI